MRASKTQRRLKQGGLIRMCATGHYIPFYIRYAAHFGFDAIWVDLEHHTMHDREIQSLLGLCHYNDIDALVRPATREPGRLNRYLEDGATGFIFPMVSDAKTAAQLVSAVKFPPLGNRGFAGAGLDADYILSLLQPEPTYQQDANQEVFVCMQIETPEAVANAAEIAAVPGVDLLLVGPADLSLRIAPDVTIEQCVETVKAAAQQYDKAWGIATADKDMLTRCRQMGAQLLPVGYEYELRGVLENAKTFLDTLTDM